MIRYVIEMFKFIGKLINPNYHLKKIQLRDISQYERLIIQGRENYFLEGYESYNWNPLKRSLNVGYIPSIIVQINLRKDSNSFTYSIINGNHRFFILSENKKENHYLTVWVNKKLSEKNLKAVRTGINFEKKIKEVENKLKQDYSRRINKLPNKRIMKKN